MNFAAFTVGTRTFTAAEQAAAFDAYIQQDPYLSEHRGEYAERNGLVMPMFRQPRPVASARISSATSAASGTASRSGLDILNFGNLLNRNWGVQQRPVRHSTTPTSSCRSSPTPAWTRRVARPTGWRWSTTS